MPGVQSYKHGSRHWCHSRFSCAITGTIRGTVMSSVAARERYLHKRTAIINKFCKAYDFSVNPLNRGYQLRVENLVDFYPVNGRYCILQSGERGDWNTARDMREIMLSALPGKKDIVMLPADDVYRLSLPKFTHGLDMSNNEPAPNFWHRLLRWFK